ncbi:hypothetical protein HK102_010380 [Quaeritorhiza haematococci]|nr:hypothetical protein HK102_010380 [Quaeritorhiza haematococci]
MVFVLPVLGVGLVFVLLAMDAASHGPYSTWYNRKCQRLADDAKLIGRPEAEVVEVLGPPTFTYLDRTYNYAPVRWFPTAKFQSWYGSVSEKPSNLGSAIHYETWAIPPVASRFAMPDLALSGRTAVVHTERIIEWSVSIWSEWLGRRVMSVEATALRDGVDVEEVRVELSDARCPYFISWQQEDGASDETLFHWLSVQHTSHFKESSLEGSAPPPALARLQGSVVERVELYGHQDLDAVVAAIVLSRGTGVGFATARELASKGRFSRFGVAELAVVDENRLRRELSRQGIERVGELRAGVA